MVEKRNIYYLDETWANVGHTRAKTWHDNTVTSTRNAFRRGLTTGLRNPSRLGKRLIILRIGNENGFVNGGCLVFESNKNKDYHKDVTAEVFEEWFKQVLNELPMGSVIVMDNASYHSRKSVRISNTNSEKAEI